MVEMNGHMEQTGFEVGVVVSKRNAGDEKDESDCIQVLVSELEKAGLIVERVYGISDDFIKLAVPSEILGRVATDLQLKKPTHIGMDIHFEWDQVAAFVRQPDGSLFSWCERFRCFHHLVYGIVNMTESAITLRFDGKVFEWKMGESLLKKLETKGIVRKVFPLHDETKRKWLLRNWALNWLDFSWQPIDEVYSYYGTKIATYFAFLGMYTKWLSCPAAFGLTLHLVDFGSWQLMVLPIFFIFTIMWAALFLQFWKRKNAALLTRWQISYSEESETVSKAVDTDRGSFVQPHVDHKQLRSGEKSKEGNKIFHSEEWFWRLMRFRNDVIVVLGIICLQLPFELAYAHFYEFAGSDIMKFGLTAVYFLIIQYYTRVCGKVSVKLIKYEHNRSMESSADSLVYKVFENLLENSIPYLKYSYKKYKAVHKKKCENGLSTRKSIQLVFRVEKEYLKPSYCASIGEELEDGLFDDFLKLALQFGLIMMFSCAFPLAFAFAGVNNLTEIRIDALKLLTILRRPIPRAAATIGAWLNIFQFLIVMSICTNCALLVCLYDQEGKWTIEPGLAAILIVEHLLLLLKFVFSHLVPEEPAWVRANRVKNAAQAQDMCSKQLRSLYSMKKRMEE
ncbi:anoctamin-like protein Os01g0706700 isoform X2 [Aristolochia californica]|uniref:anoctamin-like protein Os01g0706700 isoform X2 n=1 Tax=Aristolochia californica TaxID=171875 RepID=UPI0035DF2E46